MGNFVVYDTYVLYWNSIYARKICTNSTKRLETFIFPRKTEFYCTSSYNTSNENIWHNRLIP